MKKIITFILLSFFINSFVYAQNNAYPEENKIYICKDKQYPEIIRELEFIKVKKKKLSLEDLGKNLNNVLYIVKKKAEVSGVEVNNLHYALSVNGPTFFFIVEEVDDSSKIFVIELFDKNDGIYIEWTLWIDNNSYEQLKNHPNRLGYDLNEYEKVSNLNESDFSKAFKNTEALYNLLVTINKLKEMQKFMRYQQIFSCK